MVESLKREIEDLYVVRRVTLKKIIGDLEGVKLWS